MNLYLKQKPIFIRERTKVYDDAGAVRYTAKRAVFSWRKTIRLFDADRAECALIQKKRFSVPPRFSISRGGTEVAEVVLKSRFTDPVYIVKGPGWQSEGGFRKKDGSVVYEREITDGTRTVMTIRKKRKWRGEAYELSVSPDADEVLVLAVALVMDAYW